MTTFNSFVGPSVFALPFAFTTCGWALSLIILLAIGAFTTFSMFVLIECKNYCRPQNMKTLVGISKECFGRYFSVLIECLMVLSELCNCVACFMISTCTLESMAPTVIQQIFVLIVFIMLFLVLFIRSIRLISFMTVFSNILIICVIVLIIANILLVGSPASNHNPFLWNNLPFLLGVSLFSFEGAGLVLPIQNSMARPSFFMSVLCFVLFLSFLLFCCFGLLTSLFLEIPIDEFVFVNSGSGTSYLRLSVCCLVAVIGFVELYLKLFAVSEAIEEYKCVRYVHKKSKAAYWIVILLLRVSLVSAAAIPSLTPFRRHFCYFISIAGCSVRGFILLVLPLLMHLRLGWRNIFWLRKMAEIIILSIASVVLCSSLVFVLKDAVVLLSMESQNG
eukprot:MONOS_11878.1-p1 / transcript=MONOS_11878.1 / gene=MONOS_11878 / organism=Monocercomonoides_exilis_PA203 / gene_product=unspecified product / transcript_product=unspecified product / location=Mono_scaffold00621:17296-18907(+) / protein_length=390 / sequence_SO=supercontig / SO=protein_coding / is_pseudo=false